MMAWIVTGEACLMFVSAALIFVFRMRAGQRWVSIAERLRWPTVSTSTGATIVATVSVILMLLAVAIIVLAWTVFEYAI